MVVMESKESIWLALTVIKNVCQSHSQNGGCADCPLSTKKTPHKCKVYDNADEQWGEAPRAWDINIISKGKYKAFR